MRHAAALSLAIIGLALPFFAAAPARALDPRTWVSGTGDDANPCSRTAPCQTFNGAIGKTAAGGEINCLDSGDFGALTIAKSITISCAAGTAGIVAFGGTIGVFINAAATDVVTLRGLDINGQDSFGDGIGIQSARAVHVEKSTIRNFRAASTAAGIFTESANTFFLFVADTVIGGNATGINFFSSGGFKVASLKNVIITGSTNEGLFLRNANVFANVTNSVISGNGGTAVLVAGGATANVDRSTIANNATALNAAASGATIRISGNNIYNNTTGFVIGGGAFIQSDSTNKTGGSNGGATVPNASLTKN